MNAIGIYLLALALGIKNRDALRAGINDGISQGYHLDTGLTYGDLDDQWAYDTGTRIGACLGARMGVSPL